MVRHALLLCLALAGSGVAHARGPRGVGSAMRPEVEPTPAWETEEGRKKTWQDMAHWYMDNNLPAEALQMVQRLREDGVDTAELRVIQARALNAQGTPEEARIVLAEVIQKWPRDASAHEAMGVVLADLGEKERAIASFQRAVKLDDTRAAAKNNLAFLLVGQGRCEEAVDLLETVVSENSTVARYRNNLALALVCTGNAPRALQLFRTTAGEADARYNLGAALEREGKVLSAVLQYQQALDIAPDHGPASEALARIGPGATPAEGAEP